MAQSINERKVVEEIGGSMKPEDGAPKCPQCQSNQHIFMFTLSQSISSTKAEIYGTGGDDVVIEKYTCRNKDVGCAHTWIVRH